MGSDVALLWHNLPRRPKLVSLSEEMNTLQATVHAGLSLLDVALDCVGTFELTTAPGWALTS
jgi:hypothetical protein